MAEVTLDKVADKDIEDEYRKRFVLKAGVPINSSEEAAKHFAVILNEDQSRESFVVMFLNGANKLIATEVLFKGTLTTSAVYPREIIIKALENNAAAIVCGHNHPSGNLNPSRDDMNITKKVKEACNTIDIALHDHIIVAGESYYSFADHGLL